MTLSELRAVLERNGGSGGSAQAVSTEPDRMVRDSLPRVWRQAPDATGGYAALSLDCAVQHPVRLGAVCLWCRCIRSRPCPAHPVGIRPEAARAAQSPRAGAAFSPPSQEMTGWQAHRAPWQRASDQPVPFPIFSNLQAAV